MGWSETGIDERSESGGRSIVQIQHGVDVEGMSARKRQSQRSGMRWSEIGIEEESESDARVHNAKMPRYEVENIRAGCQERRDMSQSGPLKKGRLDSQDDEQPINQIKEKSINTQVSEQSMSPPMQQRQTHASEKQT